MARCKACVRKQVREYKKLEEFSDVKTRLEYLRKRSYKTRRVALFGMVKRNEITLQEFCTITKTLALKEIMDDYCS